MVCQCFQKFYQLATEWSISRDFQALRKKSGQKCRRIYSSNRFHVGVILGWAVLKPNSVKVFSYMISQSKKSYHSVPEVGCIGALRECRKKCQKKFSVLCHHMSGEDTMSHSYVVNEELFPPKQRFFVNRDGRENVFYILKSEKINIFLHCYQC